MKFRNSKVRIGQKYQTRNGSGNVYTIKAKKYSVGRASRWLILNNATNESGDHWWEWEKYLVDNNYYTLIK